MNHIFNIHQLQQKLQRNLHHHEHKLLKRAVIEHAFNKKMLQLNLIANTHNLHIARLTTLHGNCIFESLMYHKLFDDVDVTRRGLAVLMMLMKNKKNFFSDREDSLLDLFSFNDIEYVMCGENDKIYKYTYDAMCMDLATDSSWTRLNTELILTIIAQLYNVKIIILNDQHANYQTTISTKNDENTKTIYLGQLGEMHYVPLDKYEGVKNCVMYNEYYGKFCEWLKNNTIDETSQK